MYHWKNGWYFGRNGDGSVLMAHHEEGKPDDVQETIPENEWASIVAAVSVYGDVQDAWHAARDLHNGNPVVTPQWPR